MNISESIAQRKADAARLLADTSGLLPPSAASRARATAAALDKLPGDLSADNIAARIAAAAAARDAQRRHSPDWIRADAAFDVLVAIEEDINPTTIDEMGRGSLPEGAAEPIA